MRVRSAVTNDRSSQPEQERIVSYLPLSHVAGTMVDIVVPIINSAARSSWITMHFARPYDLARGTLGDRLRAVRPTMFLGVPRVWEKIAEKIKVRSASDGLALYSVTETVN